MPQLKRSPSTGYYGVFVLQSGRKGMIYCCLGFKGEFSDAEEAAVYFDLWNWGNARGFPLNFPEVADIESPGTLVVAGNLGKQVDMDIIKHLI